MKGQPGRGSLALRLFAIGVVQLLLAVFVGDWLITLSARSRDGERHVFTATLAEEVVAEVVEDRALLDALVRKIHDRRGIDLSIYAGDNTVLASSVEPPLALPASDARVDRLPDGSRSARFMKGDRAYVLVVRPPMAPRPLSPPLINILSGLGIVGLWAFLVSRWVVDPLRKLTRATRAFGSGDLRARANLSRRDELGEVGQTFDEMAGRIQKLLLAEKELLANVSHELRTPLARIRVALDLASEGDAAAARASLSEISVDLGELESIIDDILTATRFELEENRGEKAPRAAGFAPNASRVAPSLIARQAEERFSARHPSRPLDVTIETGEKTLSADPTLLRRAIDNLLENAHKYSRSDKDRIRLGVTSDGEKVTFEVADSGIGIPEEDLPHVFTAFFRSERSRSRGTGGVGLGLTLAKRIVEAHGGTISVSSKTDGGEMGTRFQVVIPCASE